MRPITPHAEISWVRCWKEDMLQARDCFRGFSFSLESSGCTWSASWWHGHIWSGQRPSEPRAQNSLRSQGSRPHSSPHPRVFGVKLFNLEVSFELRQTSRSLTRRFVFVFVAILFIVGGGGGDRYPYTLEGRPSLVSKR